MDLGPPVPQVAVNSIQHEDVENTVGVAIYLSDPFIVVMATVLRCSAAWRRTG